MMVITMSATGSLSDFEAFFRAEYGPLMRTMYALCRSVPEAEDLAQEAMARALERWDSVVRADSPTAYVYKIAMNLQRSRLRRLRRAATLHPDPPQEPDVIAIGRHELLEALHRLSPTQRQAFLLVEWAGLTSDEAGSVLGITGESVRGRIHRARISLRSGLEAP